MRTWINDTFPLNKLECQYFEICNRYQPNDCGYKSSCEIRQALRKILENHIGVENLEYQIGLISNENKR